MKSIFLLALLCIPAFAAGAQGSEGTANPIRSAPDSVPFHASSGNIRYLIQGEFAGSAVRQGDGIMVTITRGSIANQFNVDSMHNPLWRDIRLQLLVAQPNGKTWKPVAASAPIRVASEFDEDTTLQIDTVQFLMLHITPEMLAHTWFVIGMLATPLEGSPLYTKPDDSATTFACSAEFLDGSKRPGIRLPFASPLEC